MKFYGREFIPNGPVSSPKRLSACTNVFPDESGPTELRISCGREFIPEWASEFTEKVKRLHQRLHG